MANAQPGDRFGDEGTKGKAPHSHVSSHTRSRGAAFPRSAPGREVGGGGGGQDYRTYMDGGCCINAGGETAGGVARANRHTRGART